MSRARESFLRRLALRALPVAALAAASPALATVILDGDGHIAIPPADSWSGPR